MEIISKQNDDHKNGPWVLLYFIKISSRTKKFEFLLGLPGTFFA